MALLNSSLLLIYILICGAEDLHTRSISLMISLVFGAAGALMCVLLHRSAAEVALAVLPAAVIFALSVLSGGCIGSGDAIVAAVCAFYIGFEELVSCLLTALWLSGGAALLILVSRRFRSPATQTGKDRKAADRTGMEQTDTDQKAAERKEKEAEGLPYVTFLMLPLSFLTARTLLSELQLLSG